MAFPAMFLQPRWRWQQGWHLGKGMHAGWGPAKARLSQPILESRQHCPVWIPGNPRVSHFQVPAVQAGARPEGVDLAPIERDWGPHFQLTPSPPKDLLWAAQPRMGTAMSFLAGSPSPLAEE